MKTKLIAIILLLLPALYLSSHAQESLNAAGGDSDGPGVVSFSIGQVFYEPFHGEYSIIPGVQQPYEGSTNFVEYPEGIKLVAKVFPNPANHILVLEVYEQDFSLLQILLTDLNGKTLVNQKVISSTTEIPVKNLTPGIYLLNVTRDDKVLQAFKIIKH